MMKIAAILILLSFTMAFVGCKKEITGTESDLYGTWVKGPNFGDTLQFMRKNNQDIMRINESFNPGMPAYAEKEYSLRNGVLKIKSFSPVSQEYFSIDSFTWTQPGSEFRLLGYQIFMFMSSTSTSFTYQKI
jgi:hypothetical protein